jgi:hypothetical protein
MAAWGSRVLVLALVAMVGTGLSGPARVEAGPTPAHKCAAAKFKAAGKKEACLANEGAKGALGKAPDYAKCEDAFLAAFASAEAKAGAGVCPTEGDAAAVEALIDGCFADLQAALAGTAPASCEPFPAPSFTDNGDGTITDDNTGLMWAAKDDAGGIHDNDQTYTWANAVAIHIATLNTVPCFAGHCDWRLPDVRELQSIVSYQVAFPAAPAAFNTDCVASCTLPACSCTSQGNHWSSTSFAADGAFAWVVNFTAGVVTTDGKGAQARVRAVRGGS